MTGRPEEKEPPKVVDLMEALRRSLDAVSSDKKRPVKADLAKPAEKGRGAAPARKRKAGRPASARPAVYPGR